MTSEAILAGIGAVATGAGGTVVLVRELRRRDRRALMHTIDTISDQLALERADLLALSAYAYRLGRMVTDLGGTPPEPPATHHLEEP